MDVFISYSSKDKIIADAVCHVLEENRIKCWIAPRDVRPGERYAVEIIYGISCSKLLVLIYTHNSNKSEHVANEIDVAFNKGKTIIPFLVDNTPMNDEFTYYLSRKHWLIAYPLYADKLNQLADTVSTYLGMNTKVVEKSISSNSQYTNISRKIINLNNIQNYKVQGRAKFASFSPNGQHLIITNEIDLKKHISIWNTYTGKMERTISDVFYGGPSAFYSSDNNKIITCAGLYNANSWIRIVKFKEDNEDSIKWASLGNDSRHFVIATRNIIKVYEFATGRCINELKGHNLSVTSCSISPNGKFVISSAQGSKNPLLLWDLNTGKCLARYIGHSLDVNHASFSPNSRLVVSASKDSTIRLWEITSGNCIKTFTGHEIGVESVNFSKNGSTIVSASLDKTVRLWDVNSGICLKIINTNKRNNYASFSDNGNQIVVASEDGTISIWSY